MKEIDKIIRCSIKVNNRDVVSAICINELNLLLSKAELVQDRQMLKAMIDHCDRQIGTDVPLGLSTVCNLFTPYTEPECARGRVIYNITQQFITEGGSLEPGSVTIDMLADETIEFIENTGGIEEAPMDGKQYARQNAEWIEVTGGGDIEMEPNKPLVKPILSVTWTNNRTGNTSNSLSLSSEIGDRYKWSGSYKWSSQTGYKNPETMTSNVFTELTEDGILSTAVDRETTSAASYYITLKAPKTGYELVNGALVPASGEDTTTVTSSINFLYPVYYGIEGSLKKQLTSTQNITLTNVTTGKLEHFVYKYPSNFAKLNTITMNDAYNVTQAFNYSEEQFTTDTGLNITMRVYTSANPGAFTNAKLNFR